MAISIQLAPDIETRLQTLAINTGHNEMFHITEAILDYLEDFEDYYIAKERIKDIEEGRDRPIPIEEIMKEYGMGN